MINHLAPISGIATFNQYVATAGYDNQVILWDGVTGQALARAYHDHLANQITFSPCGNYIATASSDFTARIWSVPEVRLLAVLGHHTDDVEMVLFHPNRPVIATASRDHRARLFSLEGTLLREFVGHAADVISIEWSKSGEELVTTSDDGTVKCWDLEAGLLSRDIDMQGIETDTIVLLENGQICAGNDEGEITVIDEKEKRSFSAHRSGIKRLKYDSKRRMLASLSYDRTLKLWREENGRLTKFSETSLPVEVWPRSAAFFGENSIVLGTFGTSFATFNYLTSTWSTENVAPTLGRNAVAVLNQDIYSVGDAGIVYKNDMPHLDLGSLCNFLTPFENVLLSGGQQGIIFDALTGRSVYTHTSPLNCATVFRRGNAVKALVGTYSGEGIILGLDKNGMARFETVIRLHKNAIKGVSASETCLFSVCATGALAVHSIETFESLIHSDKAHDRIANGCTWLDSDSFASVSRDLKLRIWNISNRRHETLNTPHDRSIKCVAATNKGRFIATGSYNGRVSVYDVKEKKWVFNQRLTCAGISSLAAHGEEFLASSYDGNLYPVRPAGAAK